MLLLHGHGVGYMGLFVHPFNKRNDVKNCSAIVIPYTWSTPEAGSLEASLRPLVSVLPAASVNLTSSRLCRAHVEVYPAVSIPTHAYGCIPSTGKTVLSCQQLTEVSQTPRAKTCGLL